MNTWHDDREAKARQRQKRARRKANRDKGEATPPTSSESSGEATKQVDPKQKACACAALQKLDEANCGSGKQAMASASC